MNSRLRPLHQRRLLDQVRWRRHQGVDEAGCGVRADRRRVAGSLSRLDVGVARGSGHLVEMRFRIYSAAKRTRELLTATVKPTKARRATRTCMPTDQCTRVKSATSSSPHPALRLLPLYPIEGYSQDLT